MPTQSGWSPGRPSKESVSLRLMILDAGGSPVGPQPQTVSVAAWPFIVDEGSSQLSTFTIPRLSGAARSVRVELVVNGATPFSSFDGAAPLVIALAKPS